LFLFQLRWGEGLEPNKTTAKKEWGLLKYYTPSILSNLTDNLLRKTKKKGREVAFIAVLADGNGGWR
jgi:hypothetical protein